MITSQFAPVSATNLCRCTAAIEDLDPSSVIALAADSAQTVLAVGHYSHPTVGIVLLDLTGPTARWRERWSYDTDSMIDAMAFSTDGRRLWIALSDGRLHCRDVIDGTLQRETSRSGGDYISSVRLSPDASWAVVCGSTDRSPGYGYGPVDFNEYFTTLVAAEAKEASPDSDALIASILANTTARSELARFRKAATLAFSPNGVLELVSLVDGHEAAPQLLVRTRTDGLVRDTLTFKRERDFALAAVFASDGSAFWIGTRSGLLFRFLTPEA